MAKQTLEPPTTDSSQTPLDQPALDRDTSRAQVAQRGQSLLAAVDAWWRGIPSWGRRAMAQVVLTVAVVLIVLPIATAFGMLGSRPASSSDTSNSTMNMGSTTSNAPSPNAPTHQIYNAQPAAAPAGDTVSVQLVAKEALVSIAPGIAYHAWTFNGSVPGPVIRVRQGQTVNFTLTNGSNMPHSIDFHAAQTAWNVNYQPVAPGKSFTFAWHADYPGVFMYHCGTPPAMVHMANGMYGAIIVDPATGWTPAQEYVLVQSEFYTQRMADGTYALDGRSMANNQPGYVVFNGYANQYKDSPLSAQVGQKIRLFVVNAGPSQFSAFHVIGAIFSDVYVDGNPANRTQGDQTITIPPGGGSVVELTIPNAGSYPFLTHSFSDADRGALGVLSVKP